MSNTKPRAIVDRFHNIKDYTKDTPVKIAKGSLKGCTSDGGYFIWRDKSSQADCIHCPIGPIGLFFSNELELLN